MNASEQHEIHEINERLDRGAVWARWIGGGVLSLLVALILYGFALEGRVTTLESSDSERSRQISEIATRADEAARLGVARGRDLSAMAQQIHAQGRTLNRLESTLNEINQYLREARP